MYKSAIQAARSSRPVPKKFVAVTAAALSAMLLAGCGTVQIQPLTPEAVQQQVASDRQAAYQDVPPIAGRLSMEEAIARAIKYNLDRRTRLMEEALALHQLEGASLDMLPRLMSNAGYSWRDKELITRSVDSVTGLPSLANPYISSERSHENYNLSLTWNMLDFGQSYLGAKQSADRALIAGERRRKSLHVLIADVRTAFWRTLSAQKLRDDVKQTIDLAEAALGDARKAEAERLRSPVDSLRYQRQLLENLRLLESIEQELSSGRVELASLINAPLDLAIELVEPAGGVQTALLEMPVERMEKLAVTENADLRESFYNARIAVEETRKAMLRMFPNLAFNYDLRYDTDKYLINNNWNSAGLQLSWNVMNLFTAPAQKRLSEAGVKLADQRRIATQMSVLTQVHLARLQYHIAYRQFLRADQIWQADAKISEHMKNRQQAEAQSQLETVANRTTAILSLLRRYQSLAQLQGAASKVQATIGMEPRLGKVDQLSLEEIVREVGAATREAQPAAGGAN